MSQTPVITQAVRTAQGKEDGVFAETRSEDLVIPLINEMLDETGLAGDEVDDFMLGCAQQRGEQANNVARVIALLSDLGESVPATTINRWCASSMQAVISAADAIAAGQRDCVMVAGVESMSRVEMGEAQQYLHPAMNDEYNVFELGMGMTAEKVSDKHDIPREDQDEYALRSHQRAHDATESGRFGEEIVPIETEDGTVEEDEGIRPDTTLEQLSGLPTVFKSDGTVTPGNASQISDGASALLLTSESFADEHGIDFFAQIDDNNVAGVDPTVMGIGPVPATRGLLEKTGESIDDFGLVELNEAFASQTLYCQRELGIDDDIFNVNGGAISIGHPLGASGARLPVTLTNEMRRRDVERGLATLCVGFGQGAASTYTLR
ncbi:MAG: thiolase family protein [Halobacteriales archaeon]|nr:thiolase family protein [Halobacteriales archaeon]